MFRVTRFVSLFSVFLFFSSIYSSSGYAECFGGPCRGRRVVCNGGVCRPVQQRCGPRGCVPAQQQPLGNNGQLINNQQFGAFDAVVGSQNFNGIPVQNPGGFQNFNPGFNQGFQNLQQGFQNFGQQQVPSFQQPVNPSFSNGSNLTAPIPVAQNQGFAPVAGPGGTVNPAVGGTHDSGIVPTQPAGGRGPVAESEPTKYNKWKGLYDLQKDNFKKDSVDAAIAKDATALEGGDLKMAVYNMQCASEGKQNEIKPSYLITFSKKVRDKTETYFMVKKELQEPVKAQELWDEAKKIGAAMNPDNANALVRAFTNKNIETLGAFSEVQHRVRPVMDGDELKGFSVSQLIRKPENADRNEPNVRWSEAKTGEDIQLYCKTTEKLTPNDGQVSKPKEEKKNDDKAKDNADKLKVDEQNKIALLQGAVKKCAKCHAPEASQGNSRFVVGKDGKINFRKGLNAAELVKDWLENMAGPDKANLTADEKADLLAYLQSLK